MLKDVRLTRKLPLIMISLALLSALVSCLIAYQHAAKSMEREANNKLFSLLESREASLHQYFDTIYNDVAYHSGNPTIISALKEFSQAWDALPADKKTYLQRIYIEKNPFSPKLKESYTDATDGSEYSAVHTAYHPQFANLRKARSFHDIFLISPAGDLIYTSHKEKDFATNLIKGPWQNTKLAAIFRDILSSANHDMIAFSDFSLYAPSNDLPASFIAAPVFDSSHSRNGRNGRNLFGWPRFFNAE